MKNLMLLVNCVLGISILNAGVACDTIVQTSEGPKEISIMKVGDKIICFNKNLMAEERMIISIEEIETDNVVEITTEDGVIISVVADQQLFVPKKWVRADQLSLGDILLQKDRSFIGISGIQHKHEVTKLRFIVVEEHHNFLASKNGVLVHNGVVGASVGFVAGSSAVIGTYGVITNAIYNANPAVGAIWAWWTAGPVTVLAKTTGLACGIALGTATGPV